MCGLAGMMGPGITMTLREAYKELLYVSALRGREGTGVLAVNTRAKPEVRRIFKTVSEPNEFLRVHDGKSGFLSSTMFDIFMGHCRWPTMGRVALANVHPFETERFIGAHNGTLESIAFRDQKKTDSQMMFEAMEKKGIVPVLETLRSWDAYAVSIYEKDKKKLYLANNGRRPLAVAVLKRYDAIVWASEYLMLHMILRRNHIESEVFTLTQDRLYEIDMESITAGQVPWSVSDINRPEKNAEEDYYEAWLRGEYSTKGSSSKTEKLDDKIPF